MASAIKPQDLVIHVLNVGFGDAILIEFPADSKGQRSYGLVDCYDFDKTRGYLNKVRTLRPGHSQLAFLCATHPHWDHIKGIKKFVTSEKYRPKEFWDSGFRHSHKTYEEILMALRAHDVKTEVKTVRVTSGMEWYFGKVRITALAPSVQLRNQYATYGVDMNNASIVLRLEHHAEDVLSVESKEYKGKASLEDIRTAGQSVVILAGDAEFDSWAQIVSEYPRLEKTKGHDPLVKEMINRLACAVIKVAHHGSMHSTPLDAYEKMAPEMAIVSTEQEESTKTIGGVKVTRRMFPHQLAAITLEECGARVLTTDGSYESQDVGDGTLKDADCAHPGSIVVVVPPGGKARWAKLHDTKDDVPQPPTVV